MDLIKQIIEKKLEYYQESDFKKHYAISIWHFYECLNFAFSVLGVDDEKKRNKIRNKLWKMYFSGKSSEKRFKKLRRGVNRDMDYIAKCFSLIKKEQEDKPYENKDFDRPWAVAILSFEKPE